MERKYAKGYFSLKPLSYIQQWAHHFVTVEGIAQVTLIEVGYQRGDEIQRIASENVLSTLVRNNAQHRTQYAMLIYATFRVYLIDSHTPIDVEIHEGKSVDLTQYHPAIHCWLHSQSFIVTKRPNSIDELKTKKNQHAFSMAYASNTATLSKQLGVSAATLPTS